MLYDCGVQSHWLLCYADKFYSERFSSKRPEEGLKGLGERKCKYERKMGLILSQIGC